MSISVEITNLENIIYSEYILTGFFLLQKQGVIDSLKIEYKPGHAPNVLKNIAANVRKKLHMPLSYSKDWGHMSGVVRSKGKTARFAVDFIDYPWIFGEPRFLNEADIYFKCQCPKTLNKGFVHLSRRADIPINSEVMSQVRKIRPLMLGRPLSRYHNFKQNMKILEKYKKIMFSSCRKNNVLIYFGMSHDTVKIPNTHHPHLKRARIVEWAHKNLAGAKIVFKPSRQPEFSSQLSRELHELETRRPITDNYYFDLMKNSRSTINITGLGGSIPFRVIDSFLSGMALISDNNTTVDWYEPLQQGIDFLSIGDLGYELMEDIDFESSCNKISDYVINVENYLKEKLNGRHERFKRYYSPEAAARHMLAEIERSCY